MMFKPINIYHYRLSVFSIFFIFYVEELAWEGAWPGAIALKLTSGGLSCESDQSTTARGGGLRQSPSSTAEQHGRGACLPSLAGVCYRSNPWARRPIASEFTRAPANGGARTHFGSKPVASANTSQTQNGRMRRSVTFGAASTEKLTAKRSNGSSSCRFGRPIRSRESGALWWSTVVACRPDQQATILEPVW